MILIIKVTPNANKNAFNGFQSGVLKVRIQAIPDKGKANDELIEFLSESLGIAKSQIRIMSGHSSRLKKVEVVGIDEETLQGIIEKIQSIKKPKV